MVIYKLYTIRAVVLDIHGGAWSVGKPEKDAALNDEMARTCKVVVVIIDYRLAPEFPFPACIEDCKAAARWLVKNAKTEFSTDKLIISGDQLVNTGGQLLLCISVIRCMLLIKQKDLNFNMVALIWAAPHLTGKYQTSP